MTELTAFLLARIAEDEEVARDAALTVGWDGFGEQRIRSGQRWNPSYHVVKRARDDGPTDRREVADCGALFGISTANHIARWDPARVLAKCAADRRIVEMHAANSTAYPPRFDQFDPHSITVCASCGESREPFHKPGCTTLRLLALPYADHPDYREEWKP